MRVPFPSDRTIWLAGGMLLLILSWFALFLTLGDGIRFSGYLNAIGFWLALAALAAAAWLALRRVWVGAGAGVVLAVAILAQGGIAVHGARALAATAPRFRLVTASLRTSNADMDSAARMLVGERPDVVVVQEAHIDALVAAIERRTGAHWNVARRGNELIACRCATTDVTDGERLRARVALPGGPVTIWNLHAPKDYGRPAEIRLYFETLRDDMRAHQPGIAAGDYNSTPWNDGYRLIAADFTDAWLAAGRGPGFTFPTGPRRAGKAIPFTRIDHVFSSRLTPVEATLGAASAGADHVPIAVTFEGAAR